MTGIALKFSFAFCAVLLCTAALSAQVPAYTVAGPIPPVLRSVKAIFISNGGSDGELFPDSFSGDDDRPYSQFYAALKSTGKYDLVSSPYQADFVLYLRLLVAYCPSKEAKCVGTNGLLPMFRLTIYDRQTHFVLWTITEPIEGALLLKNQNRNFDSALSSLVREFERVTGKIPANP
jgi:hypothetical protein